MLRCGIEAALGKGVAPKDAPYAEQDAEENAYVVDRPLGVFRAGGRIEAGMAGEVFLIEADKEHAKALQIGLKHPPFQIAEVGLRELRRADRQAVSPF